MSSRDGNEGEIAFTVFDFLREQVPLAQLRKALAWVIVKPHAGSVITRTYDLGIHGEVTEAAVRERCVMYAKKFLLRLPPRTPSQ